MSLTRRDYILRMIEQLGESLARIAGRRESGELDEARQLWRTTADAIFGPLLAMIERLDTPSAVSMLGGGDKIYAYAALIEERARIAQTAGDARAALVDDRRALELYLELAISGSVEGRARAAIERLRTTVDTARLDARYRDALRGLSH